MKSNNPLDVFNEALFTRKEMDDAKANAVTAIPHFEKPAPPPVPPKRFQKEHDNILAIISTLTPEVNQAVVLAGILKEFTPEARQYIYKLSMMK